MSAPGVVPAHLDYLAIYNPALGPTDETVREQLVFYHSHKLEAKLQRQNKETHTRNRQQRLTSRLEAQLDAGNKKEEEAEQNERLRQVGLAQGMVNFVKNFSNGVPLETVETERSRVVLKEVEPDWWILASISLTQLPSASRLSSAISATSKTGRSAPASDSAPSKNVEYSSREVAPAPLLLSQLVQAHRIFLLHHASSLSEMWEKHENKKDLFRSLLHRYWTRFIWNWDVLLHGNPSVDLYNSIKLAGGGELGVGVGEEAWGSGEREVLEGFLSRTEGLGDLLVGRYGDAPEQVGSKDTHAHHPAKMSPPWLGNEEASRAEDGIIFSGVGATSKASLTVVSQWMESIYRYGNAAYGVSESPSFRPRRSRKRRKVDKERSSEPHSARVQPAKEAVDSRIRSSAGKGPDLRRKAIENHATPPGIPPPLVSVVESSLNEAVAKADAKPPIIGDDGNVQSTSKSNQKSLPHDSSFDTPTQKVIKYLSLGYGSSWTLNPKGFDAESSPGVEIYQDLVSDKDIPQHLEPSTDTQLSELDPDPEISEDESTPFVQRLEESIGKFLIGLSGDLENTEFEDESNDEHGDDAAPRPESPMVEVAKRIFLRTLVVEMSSSRFSERTSTGQTSFQHGRGVNEADSYKGRTSAAASVDGAQPNITHERVQVVVYVHQPFIFAFLFQTNTSRLTIPSFYRTIHHTLGPLQKSLLRSTDAERWRERMRESLGVEPDVLSASGNVQNVVPEARDIAEIYDLIFDPLKATIRTSIPNIPVPGSIAAEGLLQNSQAVRSVTVSGSWYTLGIPVGSSAAETPNPSSATSLISTGWTRIDALNVHTHILSTWAATRDKQAGDARPNSEELERTIKTGRNWWLVWMQLPLGDGQTNINRAKEALLVRRSPHERNSTNRETSQSRSDARIATSSGKWLLRDQPRSRPVSGSGNSVATSPANSAPAKGFTEGVGVDGKKWVDALLRLSI